MAEALLNFIASKSCEFYHYNCPKQMLFSSKSYFYIKGNI